MRIGELAIHTGASIRSIRHYESAGLLAPLRDANGYRQFRPDDVVTVATIRSLLRAGLSTRVIAEILPCYDGRIIAPSCTYAREQAARHLIKLTEQAAALGAAREHLTTLLERR